MGTILERRRKDGSTGYHAQIVVKREGRTHRETKTFDRRLAATAWIRKREKELDQPGALEAAKQSDPAQSEVIDRYVSGSRRAMGRTNEQILLSIKSYDIASKPCSVITSSEIVAFARPIRQPAAADGRQLSRPLKLYLRYRSACLGLSAGGGRNVFGADGAKAPWTNGEVAVLRSPSDAGGTRSAHEAFRVACPHSVTQVRSECIVGRMTMAGRADGAEPLGSPGQMTISGAGGWSLNAECGRSLL